MYKQAWCTCRVAQQTYCFFEVLVAVAVAKTPQNRAQLLPLKWRMLRIRWITNLRSRHQEVSSIRACLSFHRLHYNWRIQYSDARDQYFLFTGRQRRFPAGTLMRKKGTRSAWRWIDGVRAWRSRENQWYTRMMYDTWDHWWYSWATFK